ncbi:hypothetical protein [Zooshikella sp. RANM57]|uniref:hypothetical protein n=1 Tax=Zooshikella sp. RANM57 TaxID=3425863 RepID=UPI003D6F7B79
MTIPDKLIKLRLVLVCILLCPALFFSAIYIAIDIKRMFPDQAMTSPYDITYLVYKIFLIEGISIVSGIIFGVWYYIKDKMSCKIMIFEQFLFNYFSLILVSIIIIFLISHFFDVNFKFGWEVIGFAIAMIIVMYQSAYKTVMKGYKL